VLFSFQAMPGCKKFRLAPLDNEEDLEIMFSGATCTNASAMAPGAKEGSGDANNDDDVEELPHVTPGEIQPKKEVLLTNLQARNQRRILETCSSSVL
jgi:hypothetical protein